MSGLFFTAPLSKTARNGAAWTSVDAWFPELQVFANVLLSRYSAQDGERFSSFQQHWAEAYIVTPETPMTSIGTVSFPSRRDNTVFLRTDRMTFWLQVNNGAPGGSTAASAVCTIYDVARTADFDLPTLDQELHLAVFDDEGEVVASHRSLRLQGGPEFDEERTREEVLARTYAASRRADGSLTLTDYDPYGMAAGADLRVDTSSGRVSELVPEAAR